MSKTNTPADPVVDPVVETPPPVATEPVKGRVLVDCVFGAPNAVVLLSAAEAQAAQDDHLIDTDPAAVAYAESLAK